MGKTGVQEIECRLRKIRGFASMGTLAAGYYHTEIEAHELALQILKEDSGG